jgi:hypothetical protein
MSGRWIPVAEHHFSTADLTWQAARPVLASSTLSWAENFAESRMLVDGVCPMNASAKPLQALFRLLALYLDPRDLEFHRIWTYRYACRNFLVPERCRQIVKIATILLSAKKSFPSPRIRCTRTLPLNAGLNFLSCS